VERGTPRITFEEHLGELTMRKDRLVAPALGACRETVKKGEDTQRIRP